MSCPCLLSSGSHSFSWSQFIFLKRNPPKSIQTHSFLPPAAVVAAVVRSALSSFTFCLYRKLPWFLLCVIACNHRLRLRAWHRYTYQLQNTIQPPPPTTTAISFKTREKTPSTSSQERRFLFFSPPSTKSYHNMQKGIRSSQLLMVAKRVLCFGKHLLQV